ncbi:ATP-binding cassette domain-containing protein [Bacillus mangrovi]|uniref:ATP-binding cassette domain-containing protein n=1 Tax=Metabacillus mangrovi TaxID=1491830 RepID=A0A7X2S7F6_9BACI|nr:ABC transporter ATP-binding protein [Metabacillus mangrovi]MTH54668.1 ATP-binding cassette domain-containing protein [Metabacillus mangrovi]
MIEIQNVSKSYGKKQPLNRVSLTIPEGEVFGLLGPNGAGKSTLLSILATISVQDQGTAQIGGLDSKKQKKQVRRKIGYVPQDVALWEQNTVKENMTIFGRLSKSKATKDELKKLCSDVKLEDQWNEKVSSLSGGMKRKLNIAAALIHDPDILLMDEPTVGIDLQSKLEINQLVKRLAQDGKTIVYTTHDLNEIVTLFDRIGVLKNGAFSFVGTASEAEERYSSDKGSDWVYAMLQ